GGFQAARAMTADVKPAAKQGARPADRSAAKPARKPAPAAVRKPAAPADSAFPAFLEGLWPAAQSRGVSRATFDRAFAGMTPDPSLARHTEKQSEFVKPVWSYLAGALTEQRIANGRARARDLAPLLADIERRWGADPYVVLAIWGMETSYGGFTGQKSVVRALATLAFAGERVDFFKEELLVALQILQQGHVSPEAMTGSWAGAMGQTQFMPSSFLKFAVDHDGDGRRNIWTNVPDALASTANYLTQHGWVRGMIWGYEVKLPQGFDVSQHDPQTMRGFGQWASLGVRRADGEAMPTGGEGALLLPAGARGPAFLVTSNFRVIRAYNNSAAYMLGVALLSDRIAGGGPVAGRWPTSDKPLSTAHAMDIQRHLTRLGYPAGKVDGRIGEQVQTAIRAYQRKSGMVADGYATHALLEQMKKTR
ncbi:MAG: lytic transglycosylase, partial [Hyphomicrobiales bacterium]|nr:lytic transglycosylase [Hyphomicrobiales bacterium]